MTKLEEKKRELHLLEIQDRKERAEKYFTILEQKAKTIVGRCFILSNQNHRWQAFKVISYSSTGYAGGINKWIEFKLDKVVSFVSPKGEGYSQTHHILNDNMLTFTAKIPNKGRIISIGTLLADLPQDSKYGNADSEIITFGRKEVDYKDHQEQLVEVDAALGACSMWLNRMKEIPEEMFNDMLNIVIDNQDKTIQFIKKYHNFIK